MPSKAPPCPRGHTGSEYSVRKDGWATTNQGRRQMWRCVSAKGVGHRFYGAPAGTDRDEDGRRGEPHDIRCPKPGHSDAVIQSRGTRTTKTGTWRRFTCKPPKGNGHTFKVEVTENAVAAAVVVRTPPPPCPEHPDSQVVRAGVYGKNTKRGPRQRYLCRPEDGKEHQFTPPLSREAVSDGEACARCDELLSPHHGPITAARHTPWPLATVAQALNDLSLGLSYGNVSLAMREARDLAHAHLAEVHGINLGAHPTPTSVPDPTTTAVLDSGQVPVLVSTTVTSASSRDRRNAWRVAADLVEQYAPPLFDAVNDRFKAEAAAQRDINDRVLAENPTATLARPVVYVLDELPIWGRPRRGEPSRPQWYVLTVAEVTWRPNTQDPEGLPDRETRLRLARAFSRANTDAWRLVLDELDVRPDFVVADYGSGIQGALRGHYGDSVKVVPSLWHIQTNFRDALLELANTSYVEDKERVLVDPLRKHLAQLYRDEFIGMQPADLTKWFDDLENIVASLPAPVSSVRTLRARHQPRLLEALPVLAANPHVPASNAAVENRIRMALKPFLLNRSHMFGNAERTNRLLDLLICRHAGVFTNLDHLAAWIRSYNEANGGWAPAPRQILDKQLPTASRTQRYESLKSRSVIAKRAKAQGIPLTIETAAAAPPPLLSVQRPETTALLPIREWARDHGLPGQPTGPISPLVRQAYDARTAGSTDTEAVELYHRLVAERKAQNKANRDKTWTASAEKARRKELAPLRAWAAENNIDLPRNGLIPATVQKQYDAFLAGTTSSRRRPSQAATNKTATAKKTAATKATAKKTTAKKTTGRTTAARKTAAGARTKTTRGTTGGES